MDGVTAFEATEVVVANVAAGRSGSQTGYSSSIGVGPSSGSSSRAPGPAVTSAGSSAMSSSMLGSGSGATPIDGVSVWARVGPGVDCAERLANASSRVGLVSSDGISSPAFSNSDRLSTSRTAASAVTTDLVSREGGIPLPCSNGRGRASYQLAEFGLTQAELGAAEAYGPSERTRGHLLPRWYKWERIGHMGLPNSPEGQP